MDLQGRNLQQGLTGEDVRLLHTELTLLDRSIPEEEERTKGQFGRGTLAAVQQFQTQHQLPATGVVDAGTARAINAAVNAQFPPAYTVSGQVYSTTSVGVAGLTMEVLDNNAPPRSLARGLTAEPTPFATTGGLDALHFEKTRDRRRKWTHEFHWPLLQLGLEGGDVLEQFHIST
jgi:peptidoglycan hydrolase-like protein with peptidoglycan-binding domain